MGQVGNVDLFSNNLFKTEKASVGQANEWYDKILKKETYNLDNQSCKAKFIKDGKEKEVSLETEDGMENFKKLVINPSVIDLWVKTNALVILGDIVDTGSKYLKIDGKLDNQNLWEQRLKCGWNIFYQTLQKFNAAKVVPLNIFNSTTSPYKVMINDETEVITGSNSLDMDIKIEEKLFENMKNFESEHKFYKYEKIGFGENVKENWNTISYSPRMITIEFSANKYFIQFLDFNSAILSCMKPTEDEYKKCTGSPPNVIQYKDALAYMEKVYLAIFKFKEDTLTEKTWRVMRSTISPFNSDIGDAEFYFKEFTSGNNKVNLYKAMNERMVEIFIASSINNAQVISMPYDVPYISADHTKCDDKATAIQGCFQTKNKVYNEQPTSSQICDTTLMYDLPVRDLTDANQKKTMLHVFIVGNSGKELEQVKSGKMTGGILIWNRAVKQSDGKIFNKGFMRMIFTKNYVEAKFYEVRSTDQGMQEVIKFTITPSTLPKTNLVEEFLKKKCT